MEILLLVGLVVLLAVLVIGGRKLKTYLTFKTVNAIESSSNRRQIYTTMRVIAVIAIIISAILLFTTDFIEVAIGVGGTSLLFLIFNIAFGGKK